MTDRATADERLADVGEDGLVASVVARFGAPSSGVLVGPGDDAAVLDVAGPLAVSTDTLVEGQDFRREWSSAVDVGVKTAAQNLADVAAMGARPIALLVSLAAPPDLPAAWAGGFAEGLDGECRRAGAAVVGGDVSQAPQIVVTGTALGVLAAAAVLRSGARAGDVVALAGLDLLRSGVAVPADLAPLVTAHRSPRPPYPAGPAAAAAGATAMIDTSDGLVRDAARVAEASGVLVDLDPDALAPDAALLAAAALLGDPSLAQAWVLTGGEDHALLACFAPGSALPPPFTPIGRVVAVDGSEGSDGSVRSDGSDGSVPVLVGGRPWHGSTGWRHF